MKCYIKGLVLKRNSTQFGYHPDFASQYYWQRIHQTKGHKLLDDHTLRAKVISYLKGGWSPELISGRLQLEAGKKVISDETIYKFIYSEEGLKLKLYRYLMLKRKFRYPKIKRRRNMQANARKKLIACRDNSINAREKFGHWEGDLVIFTKAKTKLFTLRERKSRLIVAMKNPSRKAQATTATLLKYMQEKFDNTVDSLTLDNDVAFANQEQIASNLNTDVYFCEPYKSYQKGAIENANKLLRTKFPQSTKLRNISQQTIDKIVKKLNDRPMKCLGFKTPNEVFYQAFGENYFLTASCT